MPVRSPADDLAAWIPRLLSVWRAARRGRRSGPRPPPDALLPDELREVAAAVTRLSSGLTRERELVGARYLDDERLLGAYLLFYWPISYLQARGVLSELPRPPRTVLDLGSGPGPLAFAALDAGAAQVTAGDRAKQALAAARELARLSGEPLATREWNPTQGRPLAELVAGGQAPDTILVGHVLNELWSGEGQAARRAALLQEARALLAPGGSLVIIEPALRDTSRALLEVRDLLVAGGAAVRAPCLFRGACPALLKPSDWCHAERPIAPPPLVAQVGKAAGLRKEAVKMSYLVLAPPGEGWAEPPPGRVFRVVSEPLAGKGRLRYMGCGPEGRMGLALQEKHVGEGNRRFEALLRGDVVALEGAEARGDGLALGAGSRVTLLAAAGRPVPRPGG
ncbi:MAG: methyltransferase domain-containing protein [Anaeromyxobacter sp.]|nr:methyltransferase domain-containing protein [Anaeromyxobacter sp.]MBL0277107.1 methyltransferase domain-containing protein [Anaeromyxobacter sp.]